MTIEDLARTLDRNPKMVANDVIGLLEKRIIQPTDGTTHEEEIARLRKEYDLAEH